MGMVLISAHILDSVCKLWSFCKCDKLEDPNPAAETSSSTQYQEAFLKYVENEYCAKHPVVHVTKSDSIPSNNSISSVRASRWSELSYNPYHLSSDNEKYQMAENRTKQGPDQAITQHVNCQPPGSLSIRHLNENRTEHKLIRITIITSPTQ
jgi:hypothetical protein